MVLYRVEANDVVIVRVVRGSRDLDALLRARHVDTLLMGGVWSNVCVEATARDAFLREYKVIYLADCTAAGDLPDAGYGHVGADDVQRVTLAGMAWHIGEVATAEDVIARLNAARPVSPAHT